MKPHHVIRDAPVATDWWFVTQMRKIREASPVELEEWAQKILPHGWGAIRKVKGGIDGKRAWLCWALVLQRAIVVRGCEDEWGDPDQYVNDTCFQQPIRIYVPLIREARKNAPDATPEQLAASIREQVPTEDWSDAERGAALIRLADEAVTGLSELPPGVEF